VANFGKLVGWTVGPVLIVGGLARAFLLEPWTVPTEPWIAASVAPSLEGGDEVLLLTRGTPKAGDLVRCADPEKKGGGHVVGRIVGMQGDVVEVQGYHLTVNGNRYDSTDACDPPTVTVLSPATKHNVAINCGRVEMGGGWNFIGSDPKNISEMARKFTIGAGKVFLLSDNRSIHDDSRDFGQVPLDTCDRRIVFRLWSAKGWQDVKHRLTVIH
jgi:signal peptidase I